MYYDQVWEQFARFCAICEFLWDSWTKMFFILSKSQRSAYFKRFLAFFQIFVWRKFQFLHCFARKTKTNTRIRFFQALITDYDKHFINIKIIRIISISFQKSKSLFYLQIFEYTLSKILSFFSVYKKSIAISVAKSVKPVGTDL